MARGGRVKWYGIEHQAARRIFGAFTTMFRTTLATATSALDEGVLPGLPGPTRRPHEFRGLNLLSVASTMTVDHVAAILSIPFTLDSIDSGIRAP